VRRRSSGAGFDALVPSGGVRYSPGAVKSAATIRLEFFFYRLVRATSRVLPFGLLQKLGATAGVLFLLVSSRRRRIVLRNLAHVFPVRSRAARWWVAVRCAAHFGRIGFDLVKWSHASQATLDRRVEIEGLDHLRGAVARGKGTFVLSAHFGHWEVIALWLSCHGFRQAEVHRPLDNPRLEAELSAARTRFGNTLIPKDGGLKGMLRTVRANGLVDILIDQKAQPEYCVTVDFLGVPTPVVKTLAALVLSTKAAVVPVFSYPSGSNYRIVVQPPIVAEAGDDERSFTARCVACLSQAILADPHLWLWFHDRWHLGSHGRARARIA
jgi:Kdo2-lipid IVA lauroyltransferase/acyltransferase